MSRLGPASGRWFLALTIAVSGLVSARPASAQLAPPTIRGVKPLGGSAGETVRLTIRGESLDRASALVFDDPSHRGSKVRIEKAEAGQVEALVTLPADVTPGPAAFRVVSPRGVSNPGRLVVSRSRPTVEEKEPNDGFARPQAVPSPCTVEGAIGNGMDVDLFAVDMRAGETLVAEAVAARAGSGLDASLTIFGPDRRELASGDDLFGRDAAIAARTPTAGRYYVQVVDANGRNRDGKAENAVKDNRAYRLTLGAIPLLTAVDPPGVRRGVPSRLRLFGANLPPETTVTLPPDTPTGDHPFRVEGSNAVVVRVGDAPEVAEVEPDDRPEVAQAVLVPAAIHGRFDRRRGGDVDLYRIRPADGRAGDYAITVHAARVGSPADPVLAILGDAGQSLAEDDDGLGRDARIERRVEPSGLLIGVREFYGRGGDRFVYRIEVEPVAKITAVLRPGARTVPSGGRAAVAVDLVRRGYDGPVTILPGPLPPGVTGRPVTIASGTNRGLMVLEVDAKAGYFPCGVGPFALRPVARDVPAAVAWEVADPGMKLPTAPTGGEIVFGVSESTSLDVTIERDRIDLIPGGSAEFRVRLDRRPLARQAAVKVSIHATEGGLSGFQEIKEVSIPAGSSSCDVRLAAMANAGPGRSAIVAIARFEDVPVERGVVSRPCSIVVGPGAK